MNEVHVAKENKKLSLFAKPDSVGEDDASSDVQKTAPKHARHMAAKKGEATGLRITPDEDDDELAAEVPAEPAGVVESRESQSETVGSDTEGGSESDVASRVDETQIAADVEEGATVVAPAALVETDGQDETDSAPAATEPEAGATVVAPSAPTEQELPVIGFVPSADVTDAAALASDAKQGSSKGGKVGIIVAGSVLAVLVIAYFVGVFVFSNRFFPNTTINGEDVSLAAVGDVATKHTQATEGYVLKVQGAGLDFSVSGDDLNLRIDGDSFANWAHSQLNPWAWPLQIFGSHALDAEEITTYDEAKLEQLVSEKVKAFDAGATQPEDAHIVYDEEAHGFKVEPEKIGTALDTTLVLAKAKESIGTLTPHATIDDKELLQPAVKKDDVKLATATEQGNKTLAATQTLRIQDKDVYTVDAAKIAAWVTINGDGQVEVNEDACVEWCQGELSSELDTVGTERTYTRPDGKNITVSGGTYGWNINGEELAHTICEHLRAAEPQSIDVPMYSTAESYNPGGKEWPDRYIDIDLSEQHVRFYDGSNIIFENDVVTGNTSQGHGTPEGVYSLNSVEEGRIRLEGQEDPVTGQPEYVSYVTYWMPFINNAVALHDATWRYSFGGEIYRTDGSHGCVNLPYEKAAELYGIANVGDVVITHW